MTLAEKHYPQGREILPPDAHLIAFTAETRMSGVDWAGQQLRKGAPDSMKAWIQTLGGTWPSELDAEVQKIASGGATPLAVCSGAEVLGAIELRDIVKADIKSRFAELREMGIRTIMVTQKFPRSLVL